MKIKEAFRYQNVLASWIAEIQSYLNNNSVILYNITEKHLRSSAIEGGKDEEIENPNRAEDLAEADLCINTLVDLYAEKLLLTQAIGKAKESDENGFNYDVAIEQNILREKLIQQMLKLSNISASKRKSYEVGYVFNQEGNQVQYKYPVETVYSLNFDKPHAQSILRKIQKERNDVSDAIEVFKLTTVIDFEPKYDMNMTATDLINQAESEKKA